LFEHLDLYPAQIPHEISLSGCEQAQQLEDSATLVVDFKHVDMHDPELAILIQQQHHRIEPGLRKVSLAIAFLPH